MSALEFAKIAFRYTSPVGWLITEGVEKAAQLVANASDKGVDQLRGEIEKQSLRMQFDQPQARIAQELAIARRIDNAEEVEIEEFYDASGNGFAGISVDQSRQTTSVGVGAEGRQITKRVYRFSGWRPQDNEVITQILEEEKLVDKKST